MTIALAFLHPVLDEMRKKGCTEAELAEIVGVSQDVLCDPMRLLPANQVYNALQKATDRTGDRQMCFSLGCRMASGHWSPIRPLFQQNETVIDFISEFSALAEKQGRAARYKLVVEGNFAVLTLRRPASANTNACYADAIAAGFFLETLRKAHGIAWDRKKIVIVLQDPDLVPENELPKSSVLWGKKGMSIRFPSKYLGAKLFKPDVFVAGPNLKGSSKTKLDLSEQVRQVMKAQIANRKFGPAQIAEALGMERWKLQDLLSKSGTSVSQLRDEVKSEKAVESLRNSSDKIERIATDLGFSDSANFARAFRKWTGLSPSEVRNGK